jgi:hypothetical protein
VRRTLLQGKGPRRALRHRRWPEGVESLSTRAGSSKRSC